MTIIIIILLIVLLVVAGISWGKHSIKKDAVHKEHEDEELAKLHKLM